ncbi:hypothetical protein [Fictibacillus macauensis]|uniref:hypothetical protein n=1 Tax=Fictibacillus macauensis TaxID=245160 RepID=UPI0003159708|nr:hypothetical protein [Fictibacillus macauensis]
MTIKYKVVEASGRFTFNPETVPEATRLMTKEEAERLKAKLEECVPFQLDIIKVEVN